jgi:23S rRNA pseudouridine1911/1915/1917 synthase
MGAELEEDAGDVADTEREKNGLWDLADRFPLRHARPPGAPDLRLDAALGEILPGCGLRARRRLWANCRISVNGRARKAGYLTRAGDVLEAARLREDEPERAVPPFPDAVPECGALRIVARNADYIVFDKVSGLHSAHIAGSPRASLEKLARDTLPEGRGLHFLTRLDCETSGLVVAALNAPAAERFRRAERDGLTRKSYLAVVQGRLTAPLLLDGRLRTDGRSVTTVLQEKDPDETRHCRILPLPRRQTGQGAEAAGESREAAGESREATGQGVDAVEAGPEPAVEAAGEAVGLVRADIMRGARHQVRALLAAAGFPLYGDVRYGGRARSCRERGRASSGEPCRSLRTQPGDIPEGPEFYLHHARLESPEIHARSLPVWVGLFAAPDAVEALLCMPMPVARRNP